MIRSRREPAPVPVRRYRYSKWRWRVLVRVADLIGGLLMGIWRRVVPIRPMADPRRILLVQLDHLGDAVLTTPLLPLLHVAYPRARIDVLASPSNQAVFEASRWVDRVLVAERNWFERRPGGWALGTAVWALGRRLRRERYDLGIDTRGDVLSVLVLALAGIPRRVGWAMGGGGFLLTDVAEWVPGRHEVESRVALLECFLGPVDGPIRLEIAPTDRDRARVGRILRRCWRPGRRRPRSAAEPVPARATSPASPTITRPSRRPDPPPSGHPLDDESFGWGAPLLAAHLGAGTAAKRWPTTHWKDLLARFLADGWRVAVIGGPEDLTLAEHLEPHPDLLDLTGALSVAETTALLERADLFIGVDSGPAHLAAGARVPSVVLFSGTNLRRQWRPWSRRTLVLHARVPCRPCHLKTCPIASHPCMSRIPPARVYTAARRWLAAHERLRARA